jgi:hypothetical protein
MDASLGSKTPELSILDGLLGQCNVGPGQDRHGSASRSDDDPLTSLCGAKGFSEVGLKLTDAIDQAVHAHAIYASFIVVSNP